MSDQNIQEDQYAFPYHYIPRIEDGVFYPSPNLAWGFKYMSNLESILEELDKIDFESLLDLGCGDGRFLKEANAKFPSRKIFGLDTSSKAINFAKAFNPNIEFELTDILKKDFSPKRTYDVITLIEVIEHIDPSVLGEFIKRVILMLNKDGKLIVTVPSVNIPVIEKHYQHFDVKILKNLLEEKFELTQIKFLNKISFGAKLIQKLFNNRFFILNNKTLLDGIYKLYRKRYNYGQEQNASQILLVCRLNKS